MRLSDFFPEFGPSPRTKLILGLIAAVIVALVVACLCWQLWKPKAPAPERAAVAQHQADGSVVLAKQPDPEAKPKQLLPAGSVVERIVRVTAAPKAKAAPAAAPTVAKAPVVLTTDHASGAILPSDLIAITYPVAANDPDKDAAAPPAQEPAACPPVDIDLTLFRNPDGTRRVVASSVNGTVLGGADIPVEDAAPAPAPKLWAVGLSYDPFKRTGGVGVDRDFNPQGALGWLRVGAELNQSREGSLGNPDFRVSAKIRF